MPCVSESGVLLPSARRMLETLGTGATLDEIAASLRLPAFRVRASLRDALEAGLAREELGVYRLTAKGAETLRRSGVAAPSSAGAD